MSIFENKKNLLIFVSILIILFLGFLFYFPLRGYISELKERKAQTELAQDKSLIEATVNSFYSDYVKAINGNLTWVDLIDKYTSGRAKNQVSGYALIFLDDATHGAQHLAKITTPIQIKIISLGNQKAEALVDFSMNEGVAGEKLKIIPFKNLLSLEKQGSSWFITGIGERTERFDEYLKSQGILIF